MLSPLWIHPKTPCEQITDGSVSIATSEQGYISCDNIAFAIQNVSLAKERIDLEDNGNRLYLVEHAMAFCVIYGIQSAILKGLELNWDFSRLSHQVAWQNGNTPQTVLGRPDGRIWDPVVRDIRKYTLHDKKSLYYVVQNNIQHIDEYGTQIFLTAPEDIKALKIQCDTKDQRAFSVLSITDGILDKSVRQKIFHARSIAVTTNWEEVIWHALGDVIGDLIGFGRICANIHVYPNVYYHNATIGCANKLIALT